MKRLLLVLLCPLALNAMQADIQELKFSPHAKERMKLRCIATSVILKPISACEKKQGEKGRLNYLYKDLVVVIDAQKALSSRSTLMMNILISCVQS